MVIYFLRKADGSISGGPKVSGHPVVLLVVSRCCGIPEVIEDKELKITPFTIFKNNLNSFKQLNI